MKVKKKLKHHFDEVLLEKINSIMRNGLIDNFQKADMMTLLLQPYGFKEAGCGTNRIAYKKDGLIFKIALDSKGIRDNDNEYEMSDELQPYVTKCYDNNGLISVAEKVVVMDETDFDKEYDEIMGILQKLCGRYVLNDVGPKSFLNWGINSEGHSVILDYGYIRPTTSDMKFICRREGCDGKLFYSEDFSSFDCEICGREHSIVQIAGDGVFLDEYEKEELSDDDINTEGLNENLNSDEQNDNIIIERDDIEMATVQDVIKEKIKNNFNTEILKNNDIKNSLKKTETNITNKKIIKQFEF